MIRPSSVMATAALAFVTATALAQSAVVLDVRATMQQRINPAMLSIWDVSNNAMNEEGRIDPAQMDGAKWTRSAEAADALEAAGRDMEAFDVLLAASPDNSAVGEGEVPMAEVQRHLDFDDEQFRFSAASFYEQARRIAVAARARDPAATSDFIEGMGFECESCHRDFWNPGLSPRQTVTGQTR